MDGGYSVKLRPNDDGWERRVYWQRTYEPATLALMDACLRPGDHMVDVGANLGLMSLHASLAVGPSGSVTALEPHPMTFGRLQEHLRLNKSQNVNAINVAAGAEDGMLELFDTPGFQSGQASFVANSGGISAGEVAVRRLDDILPATQARTFIKIDVEGYEHQALLGAARTLQRDPIICMECDPGLSPEPDAPSAFRLIMKTGRYTSYRFANTKFRTDPSLVAADESHWLSVRHENAIFVPHSLRDALPSQLFS